MTGRRLTTLALAVASCVAVIITTISAAPQTTPDARTTIAQVARERVQNATKGYDLALEGFRSGTVPAGATSEWLRRQAQAALDLPDRGERLTVLQNCLKELKENVTQIERGEHSGLVSTQDALIARDRELECGVWLAKAQSK